MTKIQRVIIILAAFGVVSIVMNQVNAYYTQPKLKSNILIDVGTDAESINSVVINQKSSTKELNQKNLFGSNNNTLDSNSHLVTNIYQTTNGSFYFESPQLSNPHLSQQINDEIAQHAPQNMAQIFELSQLKSTTAEIRVTGPIARTKLTQTFANDSAEIRSGVYVFPLPVDASVDTLIMKIGDRHIQGEIKRKEIAKSLFTQAKAEGKKASLVSQLRPNMFKTNIANIPANSEILVTIEYQQFIKHENMMFGLRLPLSITPRYNPSMGNAGYQANVEENSIQHAQAMLLKQPFLPYETHITVILDTGLPLSEINSEHHPIAVENTVASEYKIKLDTHTPVNKDFVLNWAISPGQAVQASHFQSSNSNFDYGLVTLIPPRPESIDSKRNLVFILDVSGSMVGDALRQAKQAIALAIEDLKHDDAFNLISFHSDADRLWLTSKRASAENKEVALHYLYQLEADGGTEITKALTLAFEQPTKTLKEEGYLNQILFVTDGSVSNEKELFSKIYNDLGDYRLFTVGIGSAPNTYFMKEAASVGKGTYALIGDISMVKTKMNTLLAQIKSPAMTDLVLQYENKQDAFELEFYPNIIPDLYSGQPLNVVYRRSKTNKFVDTNNLPIAQAAEPNKNLSNIAKILPNLRIQGRFLTNTANNESTSRIWTQQLPITTSTIEAGLDKYWAREKLTSLDVDLYKLNRLSNEDVSSQVVNIKENATQVALQYSLVSQYTSLVAIDNYQANNKQMLSLKLPQTSTNSLLYILLGAGLLSLTLLLPLKISNITK